MKAIYPPNIKDNFSLKRDDNGNIEKCKLKWKTPEDKYIRSGDWVEKGEKIGEFEIKVKGKSSNVDVTAEQSGFILRTKPTNYWRYPGPIGVISKKINFHNEYGEIHYVSIEEYEHFEKDIKVERTKDHLNKIRQKDCDRKVGDKSSDSNYFNVAYLHFREGGDQYSLDIGTDFDRLQGDSSGEVTISPNNEHAYVYYFVEDGDTIDPREPIAACFKVDEFLSEGSSDEGLDDSKTGYIYVLVSSEKPNLVKIGMTERDPEERAKELTASTGVSMPYMVAYQVEVEDPYDVEQAVHQKLSGHRINPEREFFELPTREAIEAIENTL